jgi:hypothetical protein
MSHFLFHLPGDESAQDAPVPPPPIRKQPIRGIVYAVIGELIVIASLFMAGAFWFIKNWLGF